MSKSRGVMYVAFGESYLNQCLASIRSLWKHVGEDFRVHIISDRRLSYMPKSVSWNIVQKPRPDESRWTRVSANLRSPFDSTLMLDTDTLIVSGNVLSAFVMLDRGDCDILLVPEKTVSRSYVAGAKEGVRLFYRAMDKVCGYAFPLVLYNGGVVGFARTKGTGAFFTSWARFWQSYGGGRDMPPLACAVQTCKNSGVAKILGLSKDWNHPKGKIIRHAKGQLDIPGIPKATKRKPVIVSTDASGRLTVEWREVE